MLSSHMPSHFNITSGAMCNANIAPLDFAWITFQRMFFHLCIFVAIIDNPFMTAHITNDAFVSLIFTGVNPLFDI